jgi:hypothetical protein
MNMLQMSKKPITQVILAQAKIHEDQTIASTDHLMTLVSWAFLISSVILFTDETISLFEGISLHVVLEFLASLLFVVGSILFVIQDFYQRREGKQ